MNVKFSAISTKSSIFINKKWTEKYAANWKLWHISKKEQMRFFSFQTKSNLFLSLQCYYSVNCCWCCYFILFLFFIIPDILRTKKRFKEKLKNLIWTHTEAPHSNNNGTKSAPPPFNIQNILLSKMVWPPTPPPPFPLSKCLPRLNVSRGDIIEKKEKKKKEIIDVGLVFSKKCN